MIRWVIWLVIRWLIRNLEKIAGGLNVSGAGGAGGSAAGAVQSDLGCYQVCFEGGMDQKVSMFGFDSTKICLKVHPFASRGVVIDHTFIGISFGGDPASVQTEERWVYTGEGRGSYSQDWAAKQVW